MYLKEKIFADELQLIENKKIQGFATYIVNHLPDYFFEVPAHSFLHDINIPETDNSASFWMQAFADYST